MIFGEYVVFIFKSLKRFPLKALLFPTKSFFLLAQLFAFTNSWKAQDSQPGFMHYTEKDGLPSQQIYNSMQDKEGFLWFATDAGVSRFDGRIFRTYNTTDGLGDNEILEIYQDSKERIWFIPFSGKLTYYYKGRIVPQNIDALSTKSFFGTSNHTDIYEDRDGNVYISKVGYKKIIKLQARGNVTSVIDLSGLLKPDDAFATMYGDSTGQVYCISNECRLILLKDGGLTDVSPEHFLMSEMPSRYINHHKIHNGPLYFSGKGGIYTLENAIAKLIIPLKNTPFENANDVIQIIPDKWNNIWLNHLSKNAFIFRYTKGSYNDYMPVLNDKFATLSIDDEQNIWFSSNNGIYKTNYRQLQDKLTFNLNQHLHSPKVISCLADKDSGLWFGYSDGFVSRMAGSEVKHYNVNIARQANNRIIQISMDSEGNIIILSDEGTSLIKRLKTGQYSQPSVINRCDGKPFGATIKKVLFNSIHEPFLLSAFHDPLFRLNVKSACVDVRDTLLHRILQRRFSGFFDSKNRLYISTMEEFSVVESGEKISLSKKDPRLKVRIQDYAEYKDGTIFLASYNNGVLAIKDKKLLYFMPMFNGQSFVCRRILIRNDTAYVATNMGVAILRFVKNRFELLKILSGQDGLISTDVHDLTFIGNRLFIATSRGISSFEMPFKSAHLVPPPTLIIQSVKVDDSLHAAHPFFELSYKVKLIRINYVAPVMDKPELTLYRYRFHTGDTWQNTSANFIEFSKLKPGNYNIEIQAKKHNSTWCPSAKISIVIPPPYYNTVWFICLVIFLFSLFLYFVIKLQLNRRFKMQLLALKQKEALEKERNRIAADIHDDIGAELTNIVVLSQVLKRTEQAGNEHSQKVVQKIERSANQVITKMNEVIWTLNARNYTLLSLMAYVRNYVASLNENTISEIKVNVEDTALIDKPLVAEYSRNVFLVIKELLQNGVKHAKAKEIFIDIHLVDSLSLLIVYRDNGIGFNHARVRKGNGLKNIKRRIAQSSGCLDVHSEVNKGSTIKILFPINTFIDERQ